MSQVHNLQRTPTRFKSNIVLNFLSMARALSIESLRPPIWGRSVHPQAETSDPPMAMRPIQCQWPPFSLRHLAPTLHPLPWARLTKYDQSIGSHGLRGPGTGPSRDRVPPCLAHQPLLHGTQHGACSVLRSRGNSSAAAASTSSFTRLQHHAHYPSTRVTHRLLTPHRERLPKWW